ncbi:MAG: hypothetical protein ACK4YP_10465 [Myxococcota bacterium]
MASVLRPVRSVAHSIVREGLGRVLAAQRQLTEWQLAQARFAERQVVGLFELHRVSLEAGLRFTDAAARSLREGAALDGTHPRA